MMYSYVEFKCIFTGYQKVQLERWDFFDLR